MRAHQIMTRTVVTVAPETTIRDAADIMLRRHVSGLPVIDAAGKLVGIVSEGDFLRRSEIGTQRKRGRWLTFILGPGEEATSFVRECGRKVSEVMTRDPLTITEDTTLEEIVQTMERNNVKRLPVMRGEALAGIVSRANLLQAVASLAREIPDPTADDDHIRQRVIDTLQKNDWCPFGLNVIVREGIVHQRRHHRRKFPAGCHCRGGERGRREEGSRPFVLGRNRVRHVPGVAGRYRHCKSKLVPVSRTPACYRILNLREIAAAQSPPQPSPYICLTTARNIRRRPTYHDGLEPARDTAPSRRHGPARYLGAANCPAAQRPSAHMISSREMIPASRCSASSTGRLLIRCSTINCNTRVSFVAGST